MKRRTFMKSILGYSSFAIAIPATAKHWNVDWSTTAPNAFPLEEALFAITEGKKIENSEKVVVIIPDIAENKAVIPVKVMVDSPMTEENYVKSIYILTEGSNSRVIDVNLTPANGKAYCATRLKMEATGDVFAVAKLSNGTFIGASSSIKVVNRSEC